MDDEMQAMEVGDREIELRLDAFARARLSPDPQAAARIRARVMREARLQFEASRVAAHMASVIPMASRGSTVRRVATPLLATSIWLGIAVGSISAAQPGGPLYATRLWVENATVPGAGAARANAELGRLESRLSEAYAASVRGDMMAVQAALDAYREIADDAIAASAGDPALEALVAAALDKHVAVLSAVADTLAAKGNGTAAVVIEASVQRAIDRNRAVIDRIEGNGNGNVSGSGSQAVPGSSAGSSTGSGGGSTTGTGGGTSGAGGGTVGGGSGSGSDPKPDKSPKPTQAPKPTPAPPDPKRPPDPSPRAQDR